MGISSVDVRNNSAVSNQFRAYLSMKEQFVRGGMIGAMLSVYYGTDVEAVRRALRKKTASVIDVGVAVTHIDGDTYTPGIFADAVGATSLFGEAMLFVVDAANAKAEYKIELLQNLSALCESAHEFVVIEGALLADEKKKYTKYATVMEEFKAPAAERYNVFALADSLAKRDKKTLWMQLMEVQALGIPAEETIGILWWQLKSLLLATKTNSSAEAGMKDFVYQKAKRSLAAFKPGELEQLASSLLVVYHDGHAGVRDIDAALEKWVLGL
jgi:DNA polymerase III delta subunit